jgi:hypothetical protein
MRGGDDVDQSRMRRQQQQRSIPPRQSRVSDAYMGAGGDVDGDDYEEEPYDFDDSGTSRLPNSVRRYQVRSDVKGNVGRVSGDVQTTGAYQGIGRAANVPRRATQTNIPTVSIGSSGPSRRQQVNPTTAAGFDVDGYGRRRRFHWLFFVGLAMFTMLIGWILLTTVANWWQVTQDDWRYGRPRTYQVDAVVGHNDSPANPSHFIAINLRGQVEIIEFPGGDGTKAKIYMGPHLIGTGQDLAPVTLTFKDVNGDGKIDMIVNVQGSHFIFLNTGTQFRPAPGS